MHILPNANIPVAKLPIDVLIKNKTSFMKKKAKAEAMSKEAQQKLDIPEMSYREKMAAASGLLLISEYEFEHAVFLIKESDLNFQGMQYGYNKIYKFLQLNNKPGKFQLLFCDECL